jgi:ABC-type lipoprotein export system ATPase subunit
MSSLSNYQRIKNFHSAGISPFKKVNMKIEAGSLSVLLGNRRGKSTLLNMINGVDQLTSGEVLVRACDGENSIHESEDQRALARLKMGVVYQSFQLLPAQHH